jgi:hypothetical protein
MNDAEREDRIRHGRPPWWLIGLVVVVLALAVGGNFATGWRGRGGTPTTTIAFPSASEAAAAARSVVIGDVLTVRRIGQPKEPTVVAQIRVTDSLKGPNDDGQTILVSDKGFEGTWSEHLHVLLFLRPAEGGETDLAPWRVQQRFEFVQGRLQAPFSEADVRRAAAG